MSRRAWRIALAAGPAAFWALFFVWPLLALVRRGLADPGAWSVLGTANTRDAVGFTLAAAGLATLLAVGAAVPLAWVLARLRFPGATAFRTALLVPFVLPPVVVALAFRAVAGPGGWLPGPPAQRGFGLLLAGLAFFNVGLAARIIGAAWAQLDPALEDAARTLGAGPARVFTSVTLRLLQPAAAAAAALVFVFCATSFGVVLLLAAPGQATLEVEISQHVLRRLDLGAAAVLALAQLVLVAGAVAASAALGRKAARGARARMPDNRRRPGGWGQRAALGGILVAAAIFLGAPMLTLVARSFDAGLGAWRTLGGTHAGTVFFVAPLEAVRNSTVVAAGTVALTLPLALATAHLLARARRPFLADALTAAPLGTSAVTLGVGYLLGFAVAPLAWRTSPLILPVVHAVIALPLAVRILVPAAIAVSSRLHDAATVLGARPARVWATIDLPLLSRALAVAGAVAAAVSLGEFGAALFLARPDFPTVPVLVFRALGQPGALNLARAFALSTILAALCAAAAVFADRAHRGVLRAPV